MVSGLHGSLMTLQGAWLYKQYSPARPLGGARPPHAPPPPLHRPPQGCHPAYPGLRDASLLGSVERYFLAVSGVPWLEQRLSAMALIKGFDASADQVRACLPAWLDGWGVAKRASHRLLYQASRKLALMGPDCYAGTIGQIQWAHDVQEAFCLVTC